MRSAPHILIYIFAVHWCTIGHVGATKSAGTGQLKSLAQTVASILSPVVLNNLQGNRANRSAANLTESSLRKRDDQSERSSGNNKDSPNERGKPNVPYGNHAYPYYYDQNYQYPYPPHTEHHSGLYGPYVAPLAASGGHFYHSEFPYPPRFPSVPYGPETPSEQTNAGENSEGAETTTPNPRETDDRGYGVFNGPRAYTPFFPKFHDFPKYGPIPSTLLTRTYGYFGPPGFGSQVLYHPPIYNPQQNPTTTPEETEPKDAKSGNNSPAENEKIRSSGSGYGGLLSGSFHVQGYPSPAFNLFPSGRFNNVYNRNFTQQPSYGGLPVAGFYPGSYNPYLPPSTTPPPSASNDTKDDVEKVSELADEAEVAEKISTSASTRQATKTIFPPTVYDGPNVRRLFPVFR